MGSSNLGHRSDHIEEVKRNEIKTPKTHVALYMRIYPALAGIAVLIFFLQSVFSSLVKSPTFDEPGHIAGALSYISLGDIIVNPQHPPLLKELSGISLGIAGVRWQRTPQSDELVRLSNSAGGLSELEAIVGDQTIINKGADKVMFWARLPLILVSTLLVWLLFIFGRRLFGSLAGVGAAFLCALDPTMLAHSNLVTSDTGLATFSMLFLYVLWRFVHAPSARLLVLCGLALGATLTAKFSGIALVPVAGMLLLAAARWSPDVLAEPRLPWILRPTGTIPAPRAHARERRATKTASKVKRPTSGRDSEAAAHFITRALGATGALAAMLLIAFVVIQVVYLFPSDPLVYLTGLKRVNADRVADYQYFMAGELESYFASYFVVAYLLKEPLASIILFFIGLLTLFRDRSAGLLARVFVLLPMAVFFAGYSVFAANLGVRYIIPALPFSYLIGGHAFASLVDGPAVWKRSVAAVLAVWLIVAAAGIYPDHIPYFNELACFPGNLRRIGLDGGTRCGPYWLDDSNVDWGQSLKQLKAWLDRNAPDRTIKFAYFGRFPPQIYGIRYEGLRNEQLVNEPGPGLYVVSSHFVAGLPALAAKQQVGDRAAWLRRLEPDAIVGHAYYIYDIKAR